MLSSKLTNILASKAPRETSGSRTSNRYDYQKNWALCKLIELHEVQSDYLLLLDYHEDIIVLDGEIEPNTAEFFQVKTKKQGNWTINALARQPNKKKGGADSILGKLYSSHRLCDSGARRLQFVSNQGLAAKLNDSSDGLLKCEISFNDLCAKDKEKIHFALEGENPAFCDIDGLSKLYIYRADLSLDDHESHTKGKLVTFFETRYPGIEVSITAIYRALFDEIRRKTNVEVTFCNFSELRQAKGLGKSDIQTAIKLAASHISPIHLWEEARTFLVAEGVGASRLIVTKAAFLRYSIEKMDAANELLQEVAKIISEKAHRLLNSGTDITLSTLIAEVRADNDVACYCNDFDEVYVDAAIIFEVMSNDAIQTFTQKPQKA